MIKLGIVVQRYGEDVVGGAETLARDVAERLNMSGFDVTVYTTTALDYITWDNHYEPGESILKGVVVRRYKVAHPRDIKAFNQYSGDFFLHKHTPEEEMDWVVRQGPFSPELIGALEREQDAYDGFLFFTYLYHTTIEGLKVIRKPTALFPTAHDELPIHLGIMQDMFKCPDMLFFLTQAEMEFVQRTFQPKAPCVLTRTGVNIREDVNVNSFRQKYGLYAPYLIYAGRIEKGKGLEPVFEAFSQIQEKRLVDLVLIGKKLMDIPKMERIRYLGYISEEEKLAAFSGALFSIQPSPLESLSITTLESFSQRTPVVVNHHCGVLREHIDLSEGGLTFQDAGELVEQFMKLHDRPKMRKRMGEQGFSYISNHFSWPVVVKKIKENLTKIM